MKRIADLRKQKGGMTQAELAKELGVSQASISKWEENQLTIYGNNLIKLSRFFEISVDELLGLGD